MSSVYFDLYGSTSGAIEEQRLAIEQAFGIKLEGRESDYFGAYYKHTFQDGCDLKITINYQPSIDDDEENWWIDKRFNSYEILLYLTNMPNPESFEVIVNAIGDFVLLERVRIDTVDGTKTTHEIVNKAKK